MRSVTSSAPVLSTTTVTDRFGELERLRLRWCRDRQGRERGDQNCTRGASRAGSSISKNVFSSNENIDATRFVGTVSRAFS